MLVVRHVYSFETLNIDACWDQIVDILFVNLHNYIKGPI